MTAMTWLAGWLLVAGVVAPVMGSVLRHRAVRPVARPAEHFLPAAVSPRDTPSRTG